MKPNPSTHFPMPSSLSDEISLAAEEVTPCAGLISLPEYNYEKALDILDKLIPTEGFWKTQLVSGEDWWGTPLHVHIAAIYPGNIKIIDATLDKLMTLESDYWNVFPNTGAIEGMTPLHLLMSAVCANKPDALTLLDKIASKRGLDWNLKIPRGPQQGKTPLYFLFLAVNSGNPEALTALGKLEEIEKIDWSMVLESENDNLNTTSLHMLLIAAAEGKAAAVMLLNKLMNIENINWNVVLKKEGDVTPFQFLIAKACAKISKLDSGIVLHKMLSKKDLDWNAKIPGGQYQGWTPLCFLLLAVSRGNPEAIAALDKLEEIEKNDWSIVFKSEKGDTVATPLHLLILAAATGKGAAFTLLNKLMNIENINWNAVLKKGSKVLTPFQFLMTNACAKNSKLNAAIVLDKMLSKSGLDWNVQDDVHGGATPLHFLMLAVINDKPEALAVLDKLVKIENLDWNVRNAEGVTPLHLLTKAVNSRGKSQAIAALAKLMSNDKVDWNTPGLEAPLLFSLMKEVSKGNPEVLAVLDKLVNITLDRDAQSATYGLKVMAVLNMLTIAASLGKDEALAALNKIIANDSLDWNAQIADGEHKGKTPLYILMKAIFQACPEKLCLLDEFMARDDLDWEVPAQAGSEKGMTPHDWLTKALDKRSVESSSTVSSGLANNIILQGGIAPKYQPLGVLPSLPQPEGNGSLKHYQYNSHHDFISLPLSCVPVERTAWQIDEEEIHATFYSQQGELDSQSRVIFVFAGRKEAALIPKTENCRCVLVLTQSEFAENLCQEISPTVDVLVLHRLTSLTHGQYTQLHLLTARRLAVFLVAQYYQLNHFLAIDDNITKISFNAPSASESIKDFYELLVGKLANKGCISISTHSSTREIRDHELGSKFFIFNMALIRQYLPEMKDLFLLLPSADEANKPLEDAYFQAFLSVMLKNVALGYEVLSKENGVLYRSRKNRNAFAKSGIKASCFMGPEELMPLTPEQKSWIEEALDITNIYIEKKIRLYEQKAHTHKTVDLGVLHGAIHQVNAAENTDAEQNREGSFVSNYQNTLEDWQDDKKILRHYQISGIKALAKHDKSTCSILNATGCGKSMLLFTLAKEAFSVLNKGELIAVVTPQIELANQMYQDFKEYHALFDSSFPLERVIVVSSDDQSCSVQLLKYNCTLAENKTILIFCLDSFQKFYQDFENRERIRLALYDEFHDYARPLRALLKEQPRDSLFVGCTATLPICGVLDKPIYTYSFSQAIKEGYLAPVISDGLGMNYSKANVEVMIRFLPTILQHQLHPGYGDKSTLATTKGIIYFPSIAYCNAAEKVMRNAGLSCMVVHSKKEKCKQRVKEFIQQESGFILAVEMLRFGFNDVKLGCVIIAQKLNNKSNINHLNLLQQMLGRPSRKLGDKIAYVLTFNDNKALVDELLKDTQHRQACTNEYLSQSNAYYIDATTAECKVSDSDELPEGEKSLFNIEPSGDYSERRNLFLENVDFQNEDNQHLTSDDEQIEDEFDSDNEDDLFTHYPKVLVIDRKRYFDNAGDDTKRVLRKLK